MAEYVPARDNQGGIIAMRLATAQDAEQPPAEQAPAESRLRSIDPRAGRRPMFEPAAAQISAVSVVRSAQIRRAQIAALAFIGLAVLIGLVALTRPGAAPAAAQPTVLPTTQPAAAALAATATPRSCVITQTTPAFYAPAGAPAPLAIERGTACQVGAWHSGLPDWRQITIGGGAPVWVPLAVVSMASTAGLVDLAPPPTATPAPIPPTPLIIVEQAPPMPPPPTQCATVRGGGATVQRCGTDPLAQLQVEAEAAWREQMTPATPTTRT